MSQIPVGVGLRNICVVWNYYDVTMYTFYEGITHLKRKGREATKINASLGRGEARQRKGN